MDAAQTRILCEHIRERVQDRIGSNRFRLWFGDSAEFALADHVLNVQVTNNFVGKWIASNYLDDLYAATREVLGSNQRVDVRIVPQTAAAAASGTNGQSARGSGPHPAGLSPARGGVAAGLRGRLEDFVVGPSNQVAYTAAVTMARSCGRAFKLLVIHGGVGLGKTHLIHGICNALRSSDATIECRYISGEEFTNEFISAVKSGRVESFRARFRHVDVLAVDDIHFLANKKATQEEFLHTFNAIDACGRSVVLTSDRHPRAITDLTEPLADRLIAGMIVQIDAPDFVTRREILARRARALDQPIPDETLDYIAEHVTRNIRELEGALLTLVAYASLMREPVTLEAAQRIVREHVVQSRRCPDVREIERVVAQRIGVSGEQIRSASRDRNVSLARALTMYLVRRHLGMSFPEIGRALGRKNHSTVLMAVQRVERAMAANATLTWRIGAESQSAAARELVGALEQELFPTRR